MISFRPRRILPYVGPVSLLLVEPESYTWPLIMVLGLAAGDWLVPDIAPFLRGATAQRLRNGALLLVVIGLVVLAPAPLLHWFLRFTVLLGLSLALSPDEPNRPWKLFVVSFLLLLLATAHTEDPIIALPLLAFAGLAPAALADLEVSLHRKEARRLDRFEIAAGPILIAASLLVFFAIPRSSRTILGRGFIQDPNISSFQDRITLDSITNIKLSPRVAMRVKVDGMLPAGTKWRGAAFDGYVGGGWRISTPLVAPKRPPNSTTVIYADVPKTTPLLKQEFQIEPGLASHLFAARRAVKLESELPYPSSLFARGDDLALRYIPPFSQHYFAYSAVTTAARLQLATESIEELRRCLDTSEIPASYRKLAKEITAGAVTERDKLTAIERFFKTQFRYSLEVTRDDRLPPLDDFLFKNRVGHCEFFASGMVLLARTLGIPARVVDGFVTGEFSDVTGAYIVRRSDAHAWVEAYVRDSGWIELDPTPPAEEPSGIVSLLSRMKGAVVGVWTRYVADYTALEQQSALRIALIILEKTLRLMPYLIAVAAAIAWLPRLLRPLPAALSRRRRAESPLRAAILGACAALRRIRIERAAGETPREVAARAFRVASLPSLHALVVLHERATYAETGGPGMTGAPPAPCSAP
ncbi:MAG: transglutaminaseTgpA domain-containing protein [Acidobacteriota bacterium]